MPKILKFLIGLGALVVVAVICFFVFGLPALMRSTTLDQARRNPALRVTPTPLTDTAQNPAPGHTVEFDGFLIDFPWPAQPVPADVRDSNTGLFTVGKQMITMYASGPGDELARFYVSPVFRQAMEAKYFGDDPPKNDYEFTRRVLAITPESLQRFNFWTEGERDLKLFDEKRNILRDAGGGDGIFSIATPLFRGFQFNTPKSKIASVDVRLYNEREKLYLTFLTQGDAPKATQPDINRIVQSIRRDPNYVAPDDDETPPATK
jgi:hypothetical protein